MLLIKAFLSIIFSRTLGSCTISGVSFMDPLNFKPLKKQILDENPCNPLYWYPRAIPEYCHYINSKPGNKLNPVPLPVPNPPLPPPFRYPIPMAPLPPPNPLPTALAMPPPPIPMFPPPMPLPYGIPLAPTNPMLPIAGIPSLPYPSSFPQYSFQQQASMVPGIPGLVTQDGGINILPFSDAYADLLENHKQKLIRKKLQRVLDNYDDYPRKRRHRWRRQFFRRTRY